LALQDTLGNLFAGVALQVDKPYEIGDWIEVQSSAQKWAGRVQEISWRATMLIGFGDEMIVLSNRVMAQSEVSNFSAKTRPFARSILIRIPYGTPVQQATATLKQAALGTPGVCRDPAPLPLVSELAESWILLKLVYWIQDYSKQYLIADHIYTHAVEALAQKEIKLAPPRLVLEKTSES